MKNIIQVQWFQISLSTKNEKDYISLTDIARYKNPEFPADVVKNWLRRRSAVQFLWLWEKINNPDFKLVEFHQFEESSWDQAFVLSPKKWIETTHAIWLVSRSGNSGGTYAHRDIAFEFASWISPEFKLYLITEFQRLKEAESTRKEIGWDVKRELAKINYKIHTDSIKQYLLPTLSEVKQKFVYAGEADLLNILVFRKTAKVWQEENPDMIGNMRDHANVLDLVILSNIENHNAEFIEQWFSQEERYERLRSIVLRQRSSLENRDIWKLENIILKK